MDNYKIKVKGELDISKATLALNSLGYVLGNLPKDSIHVIYAMADKTVQYVTYDDGYDYHGIEAKDLTVDQLKDKAVLHRNNPNDGNYSLFISEPQGHLNLYKTSEDVFYVFCNRLKIWDKSRAVNINTEGLVKKGEEKDPALISGAEALRALADGKEVEGFSEENEEWIPIVYFTVQEVVNGLYKFRLKPQTIKLELELPKPFEPEEDCHVYILDDGKTDGYRRYSYEVHGDKGNTFIGIWKTEDEIKQVVAQLRKIRGTNS
ncbi:hypothetical protein [Acinetobacter pittii]|uniref:hypothetical protein n=1 Tax=Acinetobacter pittii TaxID=48296 RepID=UPI0019319C41|nr:hypothetical protein [Acinetobacter pittii]QRF07603.1 hypothetical protein HRJ47_06240 [Acinetobacter pittii]